MARNNRILIYSAIVIAIAGAGLYIYTKSQQRKYDEIYKKSVDEMTSQYNVFN